MNNEPEDLDIDAVFSQALELSGQEREDYLDRACAGDEVVRREIDELLLAYEDNPDFLEHGPSEQILDLIPNILSELTALPEMIGPYRIREKIGEGGMAVVYLAEQEKPKRVVALKMLKPGMHNQSMIKRFASESDILGRVEHPNVAKIFDAGVENNHHYFTMEFVEKGEPIHHFCKRHDLSLQDRIDLVMQICDGVHAAHQKGIIHRDLTPSNVLVSFKSGKPWARIIDFGIARPTDLELMRSLNIQTTEQHTIIGTPVYMSPEHVKGSGTTDIRTDVFGIGAILFELISGAPPFDPKRLKDISLDQIFQIIRDEEPPAPGKIRPADLFSKGLKPGKELDWIAAKALARDMDRRYSSVSDFKKDLVNFLEQRPVEAIPVKWTYRFQKLIQRHRLASGALAFAVIALVVGSFLAFLGLVRAEAAREESDQKARQLAIINRFMRDMMRSPDPREEGRRVKVVDLLIPWAGAIDTEFQGEEETRAGLHQAMGEAFLGLGMLPEANRHTRTAWDLYRLRLGRTHALTLSAQEAYARTRLGQGHADHAEELFREILFNYKDTTAISDMVHLGVLRGLNRIDYKAGNYAGVEERSWHLIQKLDPSLENYAREQAKNRETLAGAWVKLSKLEEAMELYADVTDTLTSLLGERHPDTLNAGISLTDALLRLGRYPEAEILLRDSLTLRIDIFGEKHAQTAQCMNLLSWALSRSGQYVEAEQMAREAWNIYRERLSPKHWRTIRAINNLAAALILSRNQAGMAEIKDVLLVTIEDFSSVLGKDHDDVFVCRQNLANIYMDIGELEKAEEMMLPLLEDQIRKNGPQGRKTRNSRFNLGALFLNQGRYADALPHLEILYEAVNLHQDKGRLIQGLYGYALYKTGRVDSAEQLLLESYQILAEKNHSGARTIAGFLGEYYNETGDHAKAETYCNMASNDSNQ